MYGFTSLKIFWNGNEEKILCYCYLSDRFFCFIDLINHFVIILYLESCFQKPCDFQASVLKLHQSIWEQLHCYDFPKNRIWTPGLKFLRRMRRVEINHLATLLVTEAYIGVVKPGCLMIYFQIKNPNLGKIWRASEWNILV
jgi:hypothetical protein